MAAFWPALFLPWLSPLQALGVTLLLLLMNLFLLPKILPGVYRAEAEGMGALEVILYPVALMACVVAYGSTEANRAGLAWYMPVMAAWFALAGIDACIGLGCRLLARGPLLPWNARKPVAGVLLGAALAAVPAYFLARWALANAFIPDGDAWQYRTPALAGVGILFLFAVLAETVWFGVADNLIVPFTVCAAIPLFPNFLWPAPGGAILLGSEVWLHGHGFFILGIALGFGCLAWLARLLTLGGAALGALLAFLLMAVEPRLFHFLIGFFVLGNLATRFGLARKQAKGIAEARNGRRGAAEVFGAMGAAAWMTPLTHLAGLGIGPRGGLHPALLVVIAPLIAKTMDTVSSEIGKAVGGVTISLRSLRPVPAGSKGGVSLAGTLAGLLASALITAYAVYLGWGGWSAGASLLGIAIAANVFESYWGEYASKYGLDRGPHTNILMTVFAAVLAWLLFVNL